jgi:hypothetical protein
MYMQPKQRNFSAQLFILKSGPFLASFCTSWHACGQDSRSPAPVSQVISLTFCRETLLYGHSKCVGRAASWQGPFANPNIRSPQNCFCRGDPVIRSPQNCFCRGDPVIRSPLNCFCGGDPVIRSPQNCFCRGDPVIRPRHACGHRPAGAEKDGS